MSSDKRTAVPRPKYGYSSAAIDAGVIELGPGNTVGTLPHSGKSKRRYPVYLDGELIGHVQSSERRGEGKSGMGSRIVRVTGWPTCWTYQDLGGHSGGFGSYSDQRGQAVYNLVGRVVEQRRKQA
ncbi:hypothetical protein ACWGJ9_11430 [Curtobacterium citreum]